MDHQQQKEENTVSFRHPWVRTRTEGSLDNWKAYREQYKLWTEKLLGVWDAAHIFCLTSKLCPKAQTWNRLWCGISPSRGKRQSPPTHVHQDPIGNYRYLDVATFNESQMAAPPRANNSSWDNFASLFPLGCIKCVFALLPDTRKAWIASHCTVRAWNLAMLFTASSLPGGIGDTSWFFHHMQAAGTAACASTTIWQAQPYLSMLPRGHSKHYSQKEQDFPRDACLLALIFTVLGVQMHPSFNS